MLRVALLDDHPAVPAGLQRLLDSTADLEAVTADAYCRRCRRTFERPLPQPYGSICPACVADGDIVTLTAPPEAEREQRRGRTKERRRVAGTRRGRRRSPVAGDA